MDPNRVDKIQSDPRFQQLVAKRSRFAWQLSSIILILYFGFILVIAFAPGILGTPLWGGAVTTIGIPVGILIIIAAFVITGLYVRRANAEFDPEMAAILEDSE